MERIAQLTQDLARVTADIRAEVTRARHLRDWVRDNHRTLATLLRAGINDPWTIMPVLLAVADNSTYEVFDGKPALWFAANAGYSAKQVKDYLKTARWLMRPSAFPLGPSEAELPAGQRTAAARAHQQQLCTILADASMWLIDACRDQTRYLCAEAKGQTVPIIAAVIAEHGTHGDPLLLFRSLQERVHAANVTYKGKLDSRSYLRFSPVRQGRVAIKGFCTAAEAQQIKRAFLTTTKRTDPHSQFQALYRLCCGTTRPEAGPRYSVNVAITSDDLERMTPASSVITEAGQRVPWAQILANNPSPVEMVTIIGRHGVEVKQWKRARYFSPEQRDWASAFQTHCAHPGCEVRVRDCQAHHIVPVKDGGQTTTDNLVLVCRDHHVLNDDSHAAPGKFHYLKDRHGIPYLQGHPQPGGQTPPPRYNKANLASPVARIVARTVRRQ